LLQTPIAVFRKSDEVEKMKTLVALDSSSYADEIVNELARRCKQPGRSQIKLVSAVQLTGHWETDQQLLAQVEKILMHRVKGLQAKVRSEIEITGEVLEGDAAEAVLSAAANWNCDQIVIGSHGDTGFRRSGMGSVAASIVNEAPCSVVVLKIPPKDNTRHIEHSHKKVKAEALS
jgi:nucleotide-binding universal stress UspA family protein